MSHAPARTPTVRILVVDDAAELHVLIRAQLGKRPDFEVVGDAFDGVEAVEQALELRSHVIICDLDMPRRDGIEAIPHLRRATPHARILIHSGHDDDVTVRRATAAGAHGYLVKGATRMALMSKIDDLVTQTV